MEKIRSVEILVPQYAERLIAEVHGEITTVNVGTPFKPCRCGSKQHWRLRVRISHADGTRVENVCKDCFPWKQKIIKYAGKIHVRSRVEYPGCELCGADSRGGVWGKKFAESFAHVVCEICMLQHIVRNDVERE